ncbi:MAG: trypsin-like peptidase domain-containing protein [Solirubrobacterales bacterium]|nr:trypsin-like peptidase domain-containing protein [Solirubrobacterales bacterium]
MRRRSVTFVRSLIGSGLLALLALLAITPGALASGFKGYASCEGGHRDKVCVQGDKFGGVLVAKQRSKVRYELCVKPPQGKGRCYRNRTGRHGSRSFTRPKHATDELGDYRFKWKVPRRGVVARARLRLQAGNGAGASGGPFTWAPAATAKIHPGVMTDTEGSGQCTANFIFTEGTRVYIGQAAHCAGTGAATDTDGCDAASLPLGTSVSIDGASVRGKLAYSSWLTMQSNGEADEETCAYNDLALVEIDPADVGQVNPSIPVFGGPMGVGTSAPGQQVYTYGNSSLRQGITSLSPKSGFVIDVTPGGWSYSLYTLTPGIPGDSGSAFLNANGQALGILSTVAITPLPASNGVGDVGRELSYARTHGHPGLNLVDGTEPFKPKLFGLVG